MQGFHFQPRCFQVPTPPSWGWMRGFEAASTRLGGRLRRGCLRPPCRGLGRGCPRPRAAALQGAWARPPWREEHRKLPRQRVWPSSTVPSGPWLVGGRGQAGRNPSPESGLERKKGYRRYIISGWLLVSFWFPSSRLSRAASGGRLCTIQLHLTHLSKAMSWFWPGGFRLFRMVRPGGFRLFRIVLACFLLVSFWCPSFRLSRAASGRPIMCFLLPGCLGQPREAD